ncbi:MAG: methyltransferase domain-containing protein [Candidatus Colwellbacteria bacterium]|nr:methyltransferase domain-containing protein [Candidatus Colwellbacteria bacterium]
MKSTEDIGGFDSPLLERVRKFWDDRPCNIRHSPKEVGTLEYFEQVRERRYFVEQHIAGFTQFERWEGKSVLEVGCGIGTDTIEFAKAGARVTAVDLSPKSLEIARRRFEVYGLDATLVEANAETLSKAIPPRPYDLVYSWGVIHHTPNPGDALEEFRKYCGRETEVRVMVYAKWSWKVLWIIVKFGKGMFWKWRKLVGEYSEAQEGSPVTYVYSAREARVLFEAHGFEVLSIGKDFIFPFSVPYYRKYQYRKVWYFRWMPRFLFRALERFLGWNLLIVARVQA